MKNEQKTKNTAAETGRKTLIAAAALALTAVGIFPLSSCSKPDEENNVSETAEAPAEETEQESEPEQQAPKPVIFTYDTQKMSSYLYSHSAFAQNESSFVYETTSMRGNPEKIIANTIDGLTVQIADEGNETQSTYSVQEPTGDAYMAMFSYCPDNAMLQNRETIYAGVPNVNDSDQNATLHVFHSSSEYYMTITSQDMNDYESSAYAIVHFDSQGNYTRIEAFTTEHNPADDNAEKETYQGPINKAVAVNQENLAWLLQDDCAFLKQIDAKQNELLSPLDLKYKDFIDIDALIELLNSLDIK